MEVLLLETFILVLIENIAKIHGKSLFVQLKNIDAKCYGSDYGVNVNKYGVKCGTSLKFWKNKGWINKIDPYGWLQWYFR